MTNQYTLTYWQDEEWYVGHLKEVPGVFSQGRTLAELEENIEDAYRMLIETAAEEYEAPSVHHSKMIGTSL